MKWLLSIVFLMSVFTVRGQLKPGLINTLDDKTIIGFIEVSTTENGFILCRFKESATSEIVEYTPLQIASYQVVGSNPYFSGAISDAGVIKYFFFEQVVAGGISFYVLYNRLVISTENSPFTELLSINYKDVLGPYLSECHYTRSQLRSLSFDKEVLAKVIKTYNECMQSADKEVYEPRKALKAQYGLFVGLDGASQSFENSATFPSFSNQSLSNVKPFHVGLEVWLNAAALPSRLRMILGINYSQKRFNGITSSGSTDYANNLYFTEIKFPIRVQYTITQKKSLAWFISAGTAISIVSDFESSQIWDTQSGNTIYINEIAPFTDFQKGLDLYGGLGCALELPKKHKIVLSCSYTSSTGRFSNGTNSLTANFGTLSFSSGFVF